MSNHVNHFRHQEHPLKLYNGERKPWNSKRCNMCNRKPSECPKMYQSGGKKSHCPIYGCRECYFFIHFECAEIPQKLSHPFHPQHSLSLYTLQWMDYPFTCKPCGRKFRDDELHVYRCGKCEFNLHIKCTKLLPINDDQLKHQKISHRHPVFVCNQPIDFEYHCSFCKSCFSKTDLIYVCLDCEQLLHESCIFPQEIMHPFHPEHPLFFVPPGTISSLLYKRCNACSKVSSSYFTCSHCEFFLDLSCISLNPTRGISEYDQELQNQSIKHPHPLIRCDPIEDRRVRLCSGCGVSPIKDFIYVCLKCGVLLDKSCTQLPLEITSPFHPIHPLTLRTNCPKYSDCILCHRSTYPLKYECSECNFLVDTRCATFIEPYAIVNSRIHRHPLAFLIQNPGYIWNCTCTVCDEPGDKYFFKCVKCYYCIHLECLPSLPLVIKHDSHCDPLMFTDSRIKDASDEDSDEEFYCHACEDLRDLDDPTYYCKECHFVAHLQCVFPAILHALEAELTAPPNPPKPTEFLPTSFQASQLPTSSESSSFVHEPTEHPPSSSQASQQGIVHEGHVGDAEDLKDS